MAKSIPKSAIQATLVGGLGEGPLSLSKFSFVGLSLLRRVCPGRYMAFSAMWIAIASFIYVFDIKKAEDENGNPIELSHEYNSALVVYVFLFLFVRKCLIADLLF